MQQIICSSKSMPGDENKQYAHDVLQGSTKNKQDNIEQHKQHAQISGCSFPVEDLHRVDLVLQDREVGCSSQPLVQRALDVGRLPVAPPYLRPAYVPLVALVSYQQVPLSKAKVRPSLYRKLPVLRLQRQQLLVVQRIQKCLHVARLQKVLVVLGKHYAGVASEVPAFVGLDVQQNRPPDVDRVHFLGQKTVVGGLEAQLESAVEGQKPFYSVLLLTERVLLEVVDRELLDVEGDFHFADRLQHCFLPFGHHRFDFSVDLFGSGLCELVEEGKVVSLFFVQFLQLEEARAAVFVVDDGEQAVFHVLVHLLQVAGGCLFVLIEGALEVLPGFEVFFQPGKGLAMLLVVGESVFLVLGFAVLAEKSVVFALLLVADCHCFLTVLLALLVLSAEPPEKVHYLTDLIRFICLMIDSIGIFDLVYLADSID